MSADFESPLLDASEQPAARVLHADGRASAVLVCEHASRSIPRSLNGLGLDEATARSHAAWDIGGRDLAVALAGRLDTPLVVSCVSRLVYDCNRPPEAADAVPERSEVFAVPGNAGLSAAARAPRVRDVYEPFRALLAQTIDARPNPPVLITIHTFTPVYHGAPRAVEIGVLHDADDRAAQVLLRVLRRDSSWDVRMNAPYSATDGVTHTLRHHAIPRGLPNVMIEVRNDLVATPQGVAEVAAKLGPALAETIRHFEADPTAHVTLMPQKTGQI